MSSIECKILLRKRKSTLWIISNRGKTNISFRYFHNQDTFVNTSTPSLRATPQEGNRVDTRELEREIDRLVYELYGLTSEEIAVVEGSSKQ